MLNALFVSAIALLSAGSAVAHPASALAIAVVKEQFTNSLLVPQILPAFEPSGTVTLNWTSSVGVSGVGQVLTRAESSVQPVWRIKGSAASEAIAGGPFNVTTLKYTVMVVDANVAGTTNSTSLVRHYLQNDLTYGVNNDHTVQLDVNASEPITAYAGPAPPSGSGPHRYVVLAYVQPTNFTAPTGLAVGAGVGRFDPNAYVAEAGLTLLGATYFMVEEGTVAASISVAATSSVDSTTLPQYTPTSTITTASGTGQVAAQTSTAGAASNVASVAGGVAGVALAFLGLF